MDYESREGYRKVIAELARNSELPEQQVAEAAVELGSGSNGTRAQKHVGYWLIDAGSGTLRSRDRLSGSSSASELAGLRSAAGRSRST